MGTTAHIDFIAAAYAAAALVIGVLLVWVIADYRTQRRKIAALEMQGITRRSAERRLPQRDTTAEAAREQA